MDLSNPAIIGICNWQKYLGELVSIPVKVSHANTYIIGHYNPSVKIIDLVSHATYVVCVNFIHNWRDLQSIPNDRFLLRTFHGNFINSQSFYQKSTERKSPKKYFLYIVLMSGLGLEPWLYVYWTTATIPNEKWQ